MQVSGTSLADPAPWGAATIGEALLAPTVIYVEAVLKLIEAAAIKVLWPGLPGHPQYLPTKVPFAVPSPCALLRPAPSVTRMSTINRPFCNAQSMCPAPAVLSSAVSTKDRPLL